MKFLENLDRDKLIEWFGSRLGNKEPFFYSSVDIRDSGHKIAPVDTNLFPAGFNNLSEEALKKASEQAKQYFSRFYPEAKRIAILTENFSRNRFYWDNINALSGIIKNAGLDLVIAVDGADMPEVIETNSGELKLHKLSNDIADVIIVNKDFTGGPTEQILAIKKPVIPPAEMGWHTRRKSHHFESYDVIARDFGSSFNIDPWLISTIHKPCGHIDFRKGEGLDCVAKYTDEVLAKIAVKYKEYGIETDPYVFIKSDSGTFGMGIMTVKSGSEVLEMNKKARHSMDRIKEGVQNTEVIIQEGVPTIHKLNDKTAEPFIYCINGRPVGAILRVNETRDEFGNLNSPGMSFEPVQCEHLTEPCEFSPLGIIARLASLAALHEAEVMKAVA